MNSRVRGRVYLVSLLEDSIFLRVEPTIRTKKNQSLRVTSQNSPHVHCKFLVR